MKKHAYLIALPALLLYAVAMQSISPVCAQLLDKQCFATHHALRRRSCGYNGTQLYRIQTVGVAAERARFDR